jgi:hypothetical protein
MATNTQIVASLGWTDAPPDLACIPGDLNQLGRVMAQFFNVNSVTSELDTGSQNSIAQQALEQSAIALSTAVAVQNSQPTLRSSGKDPFALTAGSPSVPVNWTPEMPNADYMIIGTFYGDAGSLGANRPTFRVLNGSRTIYGCTLVFDDIPNMNFKFAYLVRSLA